MFHIKMCFKDGWLPVPPRVAYDKIREAVAVVNDHILFSEQEVHEGFLQEPLTRYDFFIQGDGDFEGVEVGAREYAAQNGWQLVEWDGNPELKHMCWRKEFGHGTVSVGCDKFALIVHSFGANSDNSFSSTRIRVTEDRILTERQGMEETDRSWKKNRFL